MRHEPENVASFVAYARYAVLGPVRVIRVAREPAFFVTIPENHLAVVFDVSQYFVAAGNELPFPVRNRQLNYLRESFGPDAVCFALYLWF